MTAALASTDLVYPAALRVDELFADLSYQRDIDNPEERARIRKIHAEWDPRLLGVLEVSDRGEAFADGSARYAIVDGQHRWAAAKLFVTPPPLVCHVHEGLTVAEEAELFDKLNRQRKSTNTWDHWKARRVAGESAVLDIEAVVAKHQLIVNMSPQDRRVSCVSTLEKVVKLGGLDLLDQALGMIVEIWEGGRDALDAPVVHGLAMVLWYLEPASLDRVRLGEVMLATSARQVKHNANQLKEITPGSGAVRSAIALMTLYNKRPGRRILVSNRTFTGQRRESANA